MRELISRHTLQDMRKKARTQYRELVFVFDHEPTRAKEKALIDIIKRRTALQHNAKREMGDGNRHTGHYWLDLPDNS